MRDYSTNGTAKGDRSHFAKPIGGFYRNGAGLSSDDASETAGRDFRFVIFDKRNRRAPLTLSAKIVSYCDIDFSTK